MEMEPTLGAVATFLVVVSMVVLGSVVIAKLAMPRRTRRSVAAKRSIPRGGRSAAAAPMGTGALRKVAMCVRSCDLAGLTPSELRDRRET